MRHGETERVERELTREAAESTDGKPVEKETFRTKVDNLVSVKMTFPLCCEVIFFFTLRCNDGGKKKDLKGEEIKSGAYTSGTVVGHTQPLA